MPPQGRRGVLLRPSFMVGFGENAGRFPYMVDSVRKTLFAADPVGVLQPNESG